ncbi:MAG TPA: hypothetical protein PLU43_12340, partial [Lachnospiraceae bacterium]|nr:hypothetical protein [Lachnospiraceae bacterium]
EFLYFYRLDQRDKASGLQDEEFELSKLFEPFLFFITKSCNKTQEEAVLLIKSMIYMVHGLLTLHLSGNDELTSAAMEMDLKEIISMLLS